MNRLGNLWDTIRHFNKYVMKISEGQERKKKYVECPKINQS